MDKEEIIEEIREEIPSFLEELQEEFEKYPEEEVEISENRKVTRLARGRIGDREEYSEHLKPVAKTLARQSSLYQDEDDRQQKIRREIFKLFIEYLDYKGDFEFDEDLLETVFSREFTVHPDVKRLKRHLVVLKDVDFEGGYVLDDDTLEHFEEFQKIEFRNIKDEEEKSLTHLFDFDIVDWKQVGAVLAVETYAEHHEINNRIDEILAALRLFLPEEKIVNSTTVTFAESTREFSDDLIDPISITRSADGDFFQIMIHSNEESMEVERREMRSFENFLIDFENVKHDLPVERYQRLFNPNLKMEDKIIDTVIGLESTLLKDVRSANKFRLARRSAIIKNEEVDRAFNFAIDLYEARNSIIHQNSDIGKEEFENESYDVSNGLEGELRQFFSDILCFYVEILKTQECNITEYNTEVLVELSSEVITEGAKSTRFDMEY